MRETIAEINLTNLIFNYKQIQNKVKPSMIIPVVKADAYGHGMAECVYALNSLTKDKPNLFSVATIEEAVEFKKLKKIKANILCFAPIKSSDLETIKKYKIRSTFSDPTQLAFLKKMEGNQKIYIHVNVNTGMNRIGINYKTAVQVIKKLSKFNHIVIEGIYTHFSTSDEKNKDFANIQLKRFNSLLDNLMREKINIPMVHAANSGAILDLEKSYFTHVRAGISLYGYYPSEETSESINLKPVMELSCKISSSIEIEKGDSVSYGRTFTTDKNTFIASLPIGYADGINRALSNKMDVIIKDKKYPQIGNVTMDRIMINTGKEKFRNGTKVIILGKTKSQKIDAWNLSRAVNTIPYEITCGISKRVPRVYKGAK